jgi:hypothetical protein
VVCMVGDNCSVNTAIAENAGFPLIGCASHRLNLASKAIFQPYEAIIAKVHATMVKLRALNESAWLRNYTHLRPVVNQDTRWDSTNAMPKQYTQISEHLDKFPTQCDIIPSAFEFRQIQHLLEDLGAVKDVSKDLQGATATMAKMRLLFDGLILCHDDFAKYQAPDAEIVYTRILRAFAPRWRESSHSRLQSKRRSGNSSTIRSHLLGPPLSRTLETR